MLTDASEPAHSAEASQIAALAPRLNGVSVLVCSRLFWPKLPNYDLTLPGAPSAEPRRPCLHLAVCATPL